MWADGARNGSGADAAGAFAYFSKGIAGHGRPSNTSIRDLLGNVAFTKAILSFLKDAKVGMVKGGVLIRD